MGAPTLAELDAIAAPILSANKSLHLGPFIIAMGLDAVLGGILIMQCGAYRHLGQFDVAWVKIMVLYVLLMNVAITCYTWAWIYDLFVFNFGNYGLFLSVKYLSWFYVLDSATVIVVQGFFAVRAWRLVNRSLPVLITIGTFALTAFGGGLAVKIMFTEFGSTLRAGDVKVPAYIWLFSTVIADLSITVIILYFLIKRRTGWKTTNDLLDRLVRITFESQLPPTLIAIGLATEYTIKYDSFVAIPFICVQAKFYGISLLHTLNARINLRRENPTSAEDASMQFASKTLKTTKTTKSQLQSANANAYYMNTAPRRGDAIQIETTFDVVRDNASQHIQPDPYQYTQTSVASETTPRAGRVKRAPSDDGLSLDSSTFKIPQDEESRGGEYRLDNLSTKIDSKPSEATPWNDRGPL